MPVKRSKFDDREVGIVTSKDVGELPINDGEEDPTIPNPEGRDSPVVEQETVDLSEIPTITQAEAETHIRLIARPCRGQLDENYLALKISYMNEGDLEKATEADNNGRIYCGYDLNDQIIAAGFDGKEHTYKCPKCGQTGSFRAPLWNITEAEVK